MENYLHQQNDVKVHVNYFPSSFSNGNVCLVVVVMLVRNIRDSKDLTTKIVNAVTKIFS